MPTIPTPLRAALGAVVIAVDTARSLPQKAIELPVLAVGGALQLSLRVQQRYAELTVRGDQLLSRVRGVPDEAPAWATFDESPADTPVDTSTSTNGAESADSQRLAGQPGSIPQAVAEQAADAPELLDAPSAGLPTTSRQGTSTTRPWRATTAVDGVTTTSAAAEAATASASRRARKAVKSAAAKPARSASSRRTTPDSREAMQTTPDPAVGPVDDTIEQAVMRALGETERAAEAETVDDLAGDTYLPAPRTGPLSAFDEVDESADSISADTPGQLPPH